MIRVQYLSPRNIDSAGSTIAQAACGAPSASRTAASAAATVGEETPDIGLSCRIVRFVR